MYPLYQHTVSMYHTSQLPTHLCLLAVGAGDLLSLSNLSGRQDDGLDFIHQGKEAQLYLTSLRHQMSVCRNPKFLCPLAFA